MISVGTLTSRNKVRTLLGRKKCFLKLNLNSRAWRLSGSDTSRTYYTFLSAMEPITLWIYGEMTIVSGATLPRAVLKLHSLAQTQLLGLPLTWELTFL